MNLKVLHLNIQEDQNQFKQLVAKVCPSNPYMTLSFLSIFSEGLDTAKCFYGIADDSIILMAGHLNPIPSDDPFHDFVSPYGYSGPFFTPETSFESGCLSEFWKEVDNWYLEHNVVSEFIRFSLNKNYIGYNGQLIETISNIKGKIINEQDQWINFDRKVRKNVNRAKSENLMVEIFFGNEVTPLYLERFHDIYINTMKRTNASSKFFYAIEQFDSFRKENPELCAFAFVSDENEIVSTEMLLVSEDSIFSFLGGTLEEHFNKRPNDLLKFEVINWAREHNINYFVLGGGYGKDDGIFKYKKSFFPDDVETFFTGRKIIQEARYKYLIAENNKIRKEHNLLELELSDTSFFPLYRKTN